MIYKKKPIKTINLNKRKTYLDEIESINKHNQSTSLLG